MKVLEKSLKTKTKRGVPSARPPGQVLSGYPITVMQRTTCMRSEQLRVARGVVAYTQTKQKKVGFSEI